jgi:acetylornithine deacetylase/succinyl-diaminopimelate desuccinylase-like protein
VIAMLLLLPALVVIQVAAAAGGAVQSAAPAHRQYDDHAGYKLVPLLTEVLRFPTVEGNDKARRDQQAWLLATGTALGLKVREAGLVTEIDLPGPDGAPVLGLLVHGDVQPVEADKWTIPPFEGTVRDGIVLGRGSADDKGPLVQALLAMIALRDSGLTRTHTLRLLVGSDEESTNHDIAGYLKTHPPPAYSLVLDSAFPVVVGEKAWNALYVSAPLAERAGGPAIPYEVTALEAGLTPSIVPDQARITLTWRGGSSSAGAVQGEGKGDGADAEGKGEGDGDGVGEAEAAAAAPAAAADWQPLVDKLQKRALPSGVRLEIQVDGNRLTATTRGRSAHGGVNLEGGRNALVGLAQVMDGLLPRGGAQDLLAVARLAGRDLYGTGLGLTRKDRLWGRYAVNVATLKPVEGGSHQLVINLRRTPPLTGPQLKTRMDAWVAAFNKRTKASLVAGGFYDDEPLVFDPRSKLVRRLLAAYTRATGQVAPPAISGGGTYAKRMPNSIAFGMWFPGKPYPGHDVDEQVPVADLHRGAHVLIEALVDLACSPPLVDPFKR